MPESLSSGHYDNPQELLLRSQPVPPQPVQVSSSKSGSLESGLHYAVDNGQSGRADLYAKPSMKQKGVAKPPPKIHLPPPPTTNPNNNDDKNNVRSNNAPRPFPPELPPRNTPQSSPRVSTIVRGDEEFDLSSG